MKAYSVCIQENPKKPKITAPSFRIDSFDNSKLSPTSEVVWRHTSFPAHKLEKEFLLPGSPNTTTWKRFSCKLNTLTDLQYYLKINEEQIMQIEKDLQQYEDEQEAKRIQTCFDRLGIDQLDTKIFENRMENIIEGNQIVVRLSVRTPQRRSKRRRRSTPQNYPLFPLKKHVWKLDTIQDMNLLLELSRGMNNAVWKAELGNNILVAEQHYTCSVIIRKQILHKIKLMRKLEHSHIRSHYGVGHNEQKEFFEFKEFVDGGSAADLVVGGPMNETAAIHVMYQVLEALSFLHRNNIIHGNIQAKKILISHKGVVKIADFQPTPDILSIVPHYSAPEVISRYEFTKKCDVWSIGCLLFELITGKPPFSYQDPYITFQQLTEGCGVPELPSNASRSCSSFLRICWQQDPISRPSISELMQHKFLNKSPAGHSSLLGFIRRK